MEMTSQNEQGLPNTQLGLTSESVIYLQKIANWTTFFSVAGFVFIGLMIIAGLVTTTFLSTVFAAAGKPYMAYLGLIYVAISLIYIMPVIYLYRFSTLAKRAIRNFDSDEIMNALRNLKSHFKFVGIFTIVIFVLYFLIGIGFVIAKLIM